MSEKKRQKANQAVTTVRPGESIQEVIDAAAEGAIVRLPAGTWDECLVIEKSLSLIGEGKDRTLIRRARPEEPVLSVGGGEQGTDIGVEGVTLCEAGGENHEQSYSPALHVCGRARTTAVHTRISADTHGIFIEGRAEASLQDMEVVDCGASGITARDSACCSLANSMIAGIPVGICVEGTAKLMANSNLITGNEQCGIMSTSRRRVQGTGNRMYGNGVDVIGSASAELRVPLVPETDDLQLEFPGPYQSLQEAVDALAPGGTIVVAPGRHEGGITIWKPLSLRGMERQGVVIRGAVSVIGGARGVRITEVTIEQAAVSGLTVADRCAVKAERTRIKRNRGHGIALWGASRLTLIRCVVSDNGEEDWNAPELDEEVDAAAAGMLVKLLAVTGADAAIREGLRHSCGICLNGSSQAKVKGCLIARNHAYGLLCRNASSLHVEESRISRNGPRTWYLWGCGIQLEDSAQAIVTRSNITGNGKRAIEADGVGLRGSARADIAHSTVTGNQGWGVNAGGHSAVGIRHSAITKNGGGVIAGPTARAVLLGNEIAENSGAGIYTMRKRRVHGGRNRLWGNGIRIMGVLDPSLWLCPTPKTKQKELTYPGSYQTLQETVDALAPGGTISLGPGKHRGRITIWKPLTLRGTGKEKASVEGLVVVGSQNVRIQDLCMTSHDRHCVVVQDSASVTLERVALDAGWRARAAMKMEGRAQAMISCSSICGGSLMALELRGTCRVCLRESHVDGHEYGVFAAGKSEARFSGCVIKGVHQSIELVGQSCACVTNSSFRVFDPAFQSVVVVAGSSFLTISDSTIHDSDEWAPAPQAGIELRDSARAEVIRCSVECSGPYGILLWTRPSNFRVAVARMHAEIIQNRITGYTDCAVALLDQSTEGHGPLFKGRISGRGNVVLSTGTERDTGRSPVKPPKLAFLLTEEGGELDRRSSKRT